MAWQGTRARIVPYMVGALYGSLGGGFARLDGIFSSLRAINRKTACVDRPSPAALGPCQNGCPSSTFAYIGKAFIYVWRSLHYTLQSGDSARFAGALGTIFACDDISALAFKRAPGTH